MRGQAFFRQKAGRRDSNHAAIRDGLRKLGHFVVDTASVGDGVPDLLVWPYIPGRIEAEPVFIELKALAGLEPSDTQLMWHMGARLRGIRVATVRTLDEALAALQ